MRGYTYGQMADIMYFEPQAIFEWQGNKIVNDENGNLVDEATGELVKPDKYARSYLYNRVH